MSDATPWPDGTPGLVRLPSGAVVRARAWSAVSDETPTLGLYPLGSPPPATPWPRRWVAWPDFGLPRDPVAAERAVRETYERLAAERVEVACGHGVGRTGTVLAAWCVLDGLPVAEAVAYVRRHHHPRSIDTPWQRWWLRRFA